MLRQDKQNARLVADFPISGTITNADVAVTASYISGTAWTDGGSYIEPYIAIVSASWAAVAVSASWAPNVGGGSGLFASSSISASWASQSLSSSFAQTAVSASWAPGVGGGTTWSAISGIPVGLVSSSVQVSYPQLSNIPVGIVSSSAQASSWTVASSSVATSASYATVAQNVLGSITSASYALTASYALNGGGGGSPFDLGVAQTGSIAGNNISVLNFTGAGIGGITVTGATASVNISAGTVDSASFATTASFAVSASWAPSTGGGTTWSAISDIPVGLVSSSAQINTGSFSGSFTGSYTGTGSFAMDGNMTKRGNTVPNIIVSATEPAGGTYQVGDLWIQP